MQVIRYCNEPGVVKIGELVILVPNPDHKRRIEREVFYDISFGGTEIMVEARYVISGKSVSAVFDLLD